MLTLEEIRDDLVIVKSRLVQLESGVDELLKVKGGRANGTEW